VLKVEKIISRLIVGQLRLADKIRRKTQRLADERTRIELLSRRWNSCKISKSVDLRLDNVPSLNALEPAMNTNGNGFRYTADQRAAISACVGELNEDDWRDLETLAAAYQCQYSKKILDQKSAGQIERTARQLAIHLKNIPLAKVVPPELPAWLNVLHEIRTWAESQLQPKSKSKRSNNARSDADDGYLVQLVQFYERRRGKVGKARHSPGARFIFPAANPVLATTSGELAPSAISNLIRRCVRCLGQGLATGRPELGIPTLTINERKGCV
jgi:hypothetical protein